MDEEGEDKGRDGGQRKGKKVLKCRVEGREGKEGDGESACNKDMPDFPASLAYENKLLSVSPKT